MKSFFFKMSVQIFLKYSTGKNKIQPERVRSLLCGSAPVIQGRGGGQKARGQLLGVFQEVGTTVSWGVRVLQEDEEGRRRWGGGDPIRLLETAGTGSAPTGL